MGYCKHTQYLETWIMLREWVIFLSSGTPYLEYKIGLDAQHIPSHMTFQANSTHTVNISFYTFTAIEAIVTLYRMQTNNIYDLDRNSRITITDSYITISDIVPSDGAEYLITAANAYGQSVNNLTFDLTVNGKTQLICTSSPWGYKYLILFSQKLTYMWC